MRAACINVGFILVATLSVGAGSAFADNCTGQFSNKMMGAAMPPTGDQTVQPFMVSTSVTSSDTGYTGSGHCIGYARSLPDGKVLIANTCTLKAADGDVWGFAGMQEGGASRGWWVTTHGTGKFAGAPGSTGWYENVAQDDKGVSGKWGGDCKQ